MKKSLKYLMSYTPNFMKKIFKRIYSPYKLHGISWLRKYNSILEKACTNNLTTDSRVCIINDIMLRYGYYEAACMELGVPYDVVDVKNDTWVKKIQTKSYAVIFFRPFVLTSYGKRIYDDCSFFINNIMGMCLFPSINDLWIYESKRRCALMLSYHDIPHPESYFFSDLDEALKFIESAELPIVFKTDIGSDASGVRIVKDREQGKKLINICFSSGFVNYFFDTRDRQLGFVFFQKFIPDAREWRVIRIGNSYFVYEKGRKGHFHSGSKIVIFSDPEPRLLDFVRTATDKLETDCMSVDVFEDRQGNYWINELQTYYGSNEPGGYYFEDGHEIILKGHETHEMRVNGKAGRYYYADGVWTFEEGDFARNAGCNLRVMLAFQKIGKPISDIKV